MMLQKRFFRFMNMKTETLDITLSKPSTHSLVLQVRDLHSDPEADQIL